MWDYLPAQLDTLYLRVGFLGMAEKYCHISILALGPSFQLQPCSSSAIHPGNWEGEKDFSLPSGSWAAFKSYGHLLPQERNIILSLQG